jgi:hypothetical protein
MSGVKAFSAFLFLTSSECFWVSFRSLRALSYFAGKNKDCDVQQTRNYGVMPSHAASLHCRCQILKSTLAEKYSQSRESKLNSQAPAHSMTMTQLVHLQEQMGSVKGSAFCFSQDASIKETEAAETLARYRQRGAGPQRCKH